MDAKHTGMDYHFRERVAPHYQASVRLKNRLQTSCTVHLLLVGALLAKLVTVVGLLLFKPEAEISRALADVFDLSSGSEDPLELLMATSTRSEFFWFLSVIPLILADFALRRNNTQLLSTFLITNFLFAFVPLGAAVIGKANELYNYYETRKADFELFGVPAILLWYLALSVATQVHFFAEFTAFQLRKQWRTPSSAKKRN